MIVQKTLDLKGYRRGFHLITDIVEKAIHPLPEFGLLNIFLQHTSAGITINENADPSVRIDFNTFIDDLVPEKYKSFTHTLEGPDDMPAHIKSAIIGQSLTIPITRKTLSMGVWQGIYFCEFRNYGGVRNLVLTVFS